MVIVEPVLAHFQFGWRAFKMHPRLLITSVLALFGSWVALEVAVITLQGLGLFVWLFLHFAFFFLFAGLLVGFFQMALRIVNGETPQLADLVALLGRGPVFFLASFVYVLCVAGGLALLVLPGIYVAVRYSLFGHVIAARPVSAVVALQQAAVLSEGRWWKLCWLLLIASLLNLAGMTLVGIGLLFTFPVSLLATSHFYRSLPQHAS